MGPYRSRAISVVVVTWNRRNLLQACLQSLTRQNLNQPFEVVVVDNGSTDGSPEMILKEYVKSTRFDLKLIRNSDNRGFCAANNQAFAASNTEFVALLNNDAEAEPDWLGNLLAAFDGRPDVGMAASKILVHEDPRRIDKAGHLIYPDGQNRGRGSGELDRGQYDRMEEILWPDGCAAMYRREMLDKIGGFDEDFFAYADDAELGLRARIAGWKCIYTPRAVVRHHRGATLGVRSSQRLQLIERNRVLLAAKLFPWSLLWLNGFYYALRLAAGVWAAITGKGEVGKYPGVSGKFTAAGALLIGDLKAIPLLPRMFAKRREIARIRKLSPREVRRLILDHQISLKELTRQAV
ncbi:MAG TPA: glycosyltransferase family 2 protein [Bryobacteraceae bacterium]|nr:glycosyltransferase family 2 protein [Bryobacteraceae bacterium]